MCSEILSLFFFLPCVRATVLLLSHAPTAAAAQAGSSNMQPGMQMQNLSLRDLTRGALIEILSGKCGETTEGDGDYYSGYSPVPAAYASAATGLGGGQGPAGGPKLDWSVLIFDEFSRDLIAPILKVGDLRKLGVTLFLKVDATREPVPDAPAVYICLPTEDTIRRIAMDVVSERYKSFNINWTTPISRKHLELFAAELQAAQNIANLSVKDRFLSFVSPEKDLFSLQTPASYYTIASSHTTAAQMDTYFNDVANGIVHVLLALQVVPIIASVRTAGELAAVVSNKIKDAIRDHCLSPASDAVRPVLLLCERNTDLATPLIQPSTYRALLHDTLKMELNKVTVNKKDYEMEERDHWWATLATAELYETIEAIAKEAKEAEVREKAQKVCLSPPPPIAPHCPT